MDLARPYLLIRAAAHARKRRNPAAAIRALGGALGKARVVVRRDGRGHLREAPALSIKCISLYKTHFIV